MNLRGRCCRTGMAAVLLCCITGATSGAITTSNFTEIADASLLAYPVGQVPIGNKTTLAGVDIFNSPANVIFAGPAWGDADNPTKGAGWGATIPYTPISLNLSKPVAAFGITFNLWVGDPVILRVYDGANGTGQVVGEIQCLDIPPPWSQTNIPVDFVAVWSDSVNIRSAKLISAKPFDGIRITAMALSFTPVPEPASLCLILAGLVGALRRQAQGIDHGRTAIALEV